jgi:hypothetical protein
LSASGDGRYDGDFVAVTNGGVEASGEADVFVVEIVRDEGIRLAVLVDEACGERRKATTDIGDRFADGGAGDGEFAPAIGEASKDAGQ